MIRIIDDEEFNILSLWPLRKYGFFTRTWSALSRYGITEDRIN